MQTLLLFIVFLMGGLCSGLGIWVYRLVKRNRFMGAGHKVLQDLYMEKCEQLRKEQTDNRQWNQELMNYMQQYHAIIMDKNKTIAQQEKAAQQVEAQLKAARTLHLN